MECKDAIEKAIAEKFDGYTLPGMPQRALSGSTGRNV
ncbi:DUF3849 domain-containing protein [Sporofaciens musculi]